MMVARTLIKNQTQGASFNKDPKEILRLIEDTVDVEYFIRPVINLKATNSYDSSVEIDVNEEQD